MHAPAREIRYRLVCSLGRPGEGFVPSRLTRLVPPAGTTFSCLLFLHYRYVGLRAEIVVRLLGRFSIGIENVFPGGGTIINNGLFVMFQWLKFAGLSGCAWRVPFSGDHDFGNMLGTHLQVESCRPGGCCIISLVCIWKCGHFCALLPCLVSFRALLKRGPVQEFWFVSAKFDSNWRPAGRDNYEYSFPLFKGSSLKIMKTLHCRFCLQLYMYLDILVFFLYHW